MVVHGLDDARLALDIGRAGGRRIVLLSAPGAAAYLGAGYFRALLDAAAAEYPGVPFEGVLDCGDNPGWALAALRVGIKRIVLDGNPEARRRVAAIARRLGAKLVDRRRPAAA